MVKEIEGLMRMIGLADPDWSRWVMGGAAAICAVVLALAFLLGPGSRWLAGERRRLTEPEWRQLSVAERVEAVNQARQSLMQAITGLVVIVGVAFTASGLVYTSKTLDATQDGQITDRYTKAIEQLGSGKPEIRLGGVYALQRLMSDSVRDRSTIIEVLASFVRLHGQDRPPPGSDKTRLAVDVHAALAVLGRRNPLSRTNLPLDLTSVDLHGKNLTDVRLRLATLSIANLAGAILAYADLTGAVLIGVRLTGATMLAVHLGSANLSAADIKDAHLTAAFLSKAQLGGARLTGADLKGADLRGADLRGVVGQQEGALRKIAVVDSRTRF